MKNIMQLLLSTFILTILFSCTVEKRIYSSGYHVEWSHKKQASGKETKELYVKEIRDEVSKLDLEENLIHSITIEDSDKKHDVVSIESPEISATSTTHLAKTNFQKDLTPLKKGNSPSEMSAFTKHNENSSNMAPESGGRMSGVYILLLALLFLLLAFVFYTYLGVIGMIFAIIFGIAAAALLIYGIVKIIVG